MEVSLIFIHGSFVSPLVLIKIFNIKYSKNIYDTLLQHKI